MDLDQVEPMTTVVQQAHYKRNDDPKKPADLLLEKNAPEWESGAFRVPKII